MRNVMLKYTVVEPLLPYPPYLHPLTDPSHSPHPPPVPLLPTVQQSVLPSVQQHQSYYQIQESKHTHSSGGRQEHDEQGQPEPILEHHHLSSYHGNIVSGSKDD